MYRFSEFLNGFGPLKLSVEKVCSFAFFFSLSFKVKNFLFIVQKGQSGAERRVRARALSLSVLFLFFFLSFFFFSPILPILSVSV
jgi:hypothetical protein